MNISEFAETLEMIGQAHNWRPIGDRLIKGLYSAVMGPNGIGEGAYLNLFGDFIATPGKTPAHLFSAIREERYKQLREQEKSVVTDGVKTYGQMTDAEQASYVATIQRVKAELAETLATLDEQGRIPRTNVKGMSSVGSLLAGAVLQIGCADREVERELQRSHSPEVHEDGKEVWLDA
jgi:hypothetical protein